MAGKRAPAGQTGSGSASPVAPKFLAGAEAPLSVTFVPRPPLFLLLIALLRLLALGSLSAAEVDVDAIVREVRAKELVGIFGERELCKQDAVRLVGIMAGQHPQVPEVHWVHVRNELDLDPLEVALTKHYSDHFTAEELTHVAKLFETAEMRGLITAVRILAQRSPTAETMPAEMEQLRKRFGPRPMAKLGDLINSALGRQLLAVQKSAEEVRRKEVVAALVAAETRVRARR